MGGLIPPVPRNAADHPPAPVVKNGSPSRSGPGRKGLEGIDRSTSTGRGSIAAASWPTRRVAKPAVAIYIETS
jgi:hypothetical protein